MNENKTVEQLAEEHVATFHNITDQERYLMRVVFQDAYGQAQSDGLPALNASREELARLQAENAALKEAQSLVPVSDKVKHATETVCAMLMKKANTDEEKQAVKTVYAEWEDYFTDLLNNQLDLEEYPLHNLFTPNNP